jgi:hypothetical protein
LPAWAIAATPAVPAAIRNPPSASSNLQKSYGPERENGVPSVHYVALRFVTNIALDTLVSIPKDLLIHLTYGHYPVHPKGGCVL